MNEILGVCLARNEDRFLRCALDAVAGFCDRFLLFDHGSRDRTPAIFRDFAAHHPSAEIREIAHPSESHKALRAECGKPLWVFGVDGDEVYDRERLMQLRPLVVSGEFDCHWMLVGSCLHVDALGDGRAAGFPAPPSRSITKLYHFGAISSWEGASKERLHGGCPVFRPGYRADQKHRLGVGWEDSLLRCLHLCFCRRSSLDPPTPPVRRNIDELYHHRLPFWLIRWLRVFSRSSRWKVERYRRGDKMTVSTQPFFDHVA